MATLSGQTIANTFDSLLHVEDDTAGLVATSTDSRVIQDGVGAASALALATDSVRITSTNKLYFNDVGTEHIAADGSDNLTISAGNDIVLAVAGTGSVSSSGPAGTGNTVLGIDAGIGLESGTNYNVFIGDLVGDSSLNDAINNVGVGYAALSSLTTGDRNTAVGYQALTTCSTGEENVAIGRGSLDAAVSASYNIAIGTNALGAVDDGETFNIAIGYDAMGNANNGTTDSNIVIGGYAGDAFSTAAVEGTVLIGHQAGSAMNHADDSYQVCIGYQSGLTLAGSLSSVMVGNRAGRGVTTGQANTAIGHEAMSAASATDMNSNTAVGYKAMLSESNASTAGNTIIGNEAGTGGSGQHRYNTAVGYQALSSTAGNAMDGATAIGYFALTDVTTGAANTALGYQAGANITIGAYNTAIGFNALVTETIGNSSMAIGYDALGLQLSDSDNEITGNIGIGKDAGYYNVTGKNNTYVGYKCGSGASGQSNAENTGVGFEALLAITYGVTNTCLGRQAGKAITNGTENTLVGDRAGQNIVGGDFNQFLGTAITASGVDAQYQVVIGHNYAGTADSQVHIGNASNHLHTLFSSDSWSATSDIRQKKNIKDDNLGLEFINSLRTTTYNHKSPSEFPKEWESYNPNDKEPMDGDRVFHSLIAQEVKQSLDDIGCETFGGWSVDPDGRQRVSRTSFVTPLIKAVQELSAKVEELESKLK